MVWEAIADNVGFSTGKPWLPVPESHRARAADIQNGESTSVLAAYRAMLAVRKKYPALVRGSIRFLDAEGDVLAFIREGDGERLLCVFNFAGEPANWSAPQHIGQPIDVGAGGVNVHEGDLSLPPLGWVLSRLG
ncbi:alpha-glucosidase C-terminal domain-containing protein [Mesorhizobium sp. PAMC28654]|uniref:alpha-glucosidase C-terminal domain-containing protein n=1 Tax=Mesorhizobium sp. PAMC28654 TaxID=2880934 RepID=UPI0039B46D86